MMLVAACAVSPPSPPATTAAAKSSAAAPTAAATAPAATTAAELREAARRAGYEPRTVNGSQVWCHDETPVGTRFPNTVCLTEAQLQARLQGTQDVKDMMRHPGSTDPAR